ncbi:glycosyltransferase [Roseicella aquatilis]|uniref:Glycosyltransferase family 4 protein n=1 Tax=Roseicella aquatilis TaxID=2527868 RepID=A0A4R4DV26_9PROT|nr:glycosyltransferase [Roseicella aquatilis]TCZ66894.1 glycosyltransferase family 4 protein [Roseicella aquatilis]
MRVAIVHEWLESYAGSERVVEQLLALWPQADLFAVCDLLPEAERGFLGGRPVRTSFIQTLPLARKHFRKYLALMPLAVEQFDLSGYDLVLSSNHAVAKGVITGPGQLHVSYVHSPMRYAWDLQHQYLRQAGLERGPMSLYTRWLLHRMRLWDQASATRVDDVVANSRYIAERIEKVWRRSSTVIHPPVDVEEFAMGTERGDHYLIAARMVPYKRVELVAEAFRAMPGRRLVICGGGPGMAQVQAAAAGAPNIEIRGRVPQDELVHLTRTARAFVYAAEEDFGIGMVEAQACGTPLIAYARGGSRDIVTPQTGLLFPEQSAASIAEAVEQFEARAHTIGAEACRQNALRFSVTAFRERFRAHVEGLLAERIAT